MRRTPPPGILLFVSALTLLGSVWASAYAVSESDRTPTRIEVSADLEVNATHLVQRIPVAPGDILRIETFAIVAYLYHTRLPLDFYVVEAGDEGLVANGEADRARVHLHWAPDRYPVPTQGQIPVLGRPIEPRYLDLVRPDPPPGAGDELALVFHLRHNETRAADIARLASGTPEERDLLEARRIELLRFLPRIESGWAGDVRVIDGDAARLQAPFAALTIAAALATLVSAVAYWRTRRRLPPVPAEASDMEALMHLVARGGVYLAALRNLLGVIGIFLALVGAVALPIVIDEVSSSLTHYATTVYWEPLLVAGLVGTFAALCVVWLVSMLSVQRELSRWRARADAPPLEL